jgi:hypothetical protein
MLWRREGYAILVQTHEPPPSPERWRIDVDFLTRRPRVSEWAPDFRSGAEYTFALRFSPARAAGTGGFRKRGITDDLELGWWLGYHQASWGIHLTAMRVDHGPTRIAVGRNGSPTITIVEWSISGRAVCRDPALLAHTVGAGIGKGRAFGLGLLLLGESRGG